MDDWTLYTGVAAAVLTAMSLIPQHVKIIRQKKTEDLSFIMLVVLMVGVAL